MYKDIIQNSRILIVDDQPANVLLLEKVLQQGGYTQFTSLTDSRQVIDRFRSFQPDLIILDLMMPKVDGFALMTQLRGFIPDETYLPILVVTADVTRGAKQKALSLGAKDFLTKPVDTTEAGLRIYNLLETRWLYRQIQLQNGNLEELVNLRTRELGEANRRLSILDEAKGDFLKLISHELRTPLNGLLGSAELILDELGANTSSNELREMFAVSRSRILSIVDDALLLTQISVEGQRFSHQSVLLTEALNQALRETAEFANSRQVLLQPPPPGLGVVRGSGELLVKALRALLETGVKFSNPGETLTLQKVNPSDSSTVIIGSKSGCVEESVMARFFDVFSLSEAVTAAGSLGLGPAVAYRILALFGGCVSLANRNPTGIQFTVSCVSVESPMVSVG
jgi:two-component system, sensor histidine kinase and response regulator